MKLEHRLALLTAAVTAGTIATSLVTAFVLVRHAATRELDEEVIDGANAAAVVVSQMDVDVESGTNPRNLEMPDEVALIVKHIAVYSRAGQRIATRPEFTGIPNRLDELPPGATLGRNKPFDLLLPEGPMRAAVVSSRNLRGMTVLHAVSRSQLDDVLASRARVFTLLFLATLGLIALAARWLGRRLAVEVNYVTGIARRVASGELTARAGTAGLASPETRNLARELDHMVAELAALVTSQRNFISYAAHELRSPLAALQGELQLALRRPRTGDAYVETISSALSDVDGLTKLAEDLLTLARAQADSSAVVDHAVIEAIVADALLLVQGAAQIQEVSVDVDIEAVKILAVSGRRSDLARLLRNLLENAIKFGPRMGQVRVDASLHEGYVVIGIADSGPGIAPKDRANIFDPFFRATGRDRLQVAGTGLGLTIAREIARTSGGELTYDEMFCDGTRLLVKLRVAEVVPSSENHLSA